jgi:NADH-quinone oxidoreductase subunit N
VSATTLAQSAELLFPEAILAVAALCTVALGAFAARVARLVSIGAAFVALVALISSGRTNVGILPLRGLSNTVVLDAVSLLFGAIVLAMLVAALVSIDTSRDRRARPFEEVAPLLLLSATGSLFATASTDLVSQLVAVELSAVPAYLLGAHSTTSRVARRSALSRFAAGVASTGTITLGAALLFGATGTTNLRASAVRLSALFADPGGSFDDSWRVVATVGVIVLVLGLLGKFDVSPLHRTRARALEGSLVAVAGANLARLAALSVLVRVLCEGVPATDSLSAWPSIADMCVRLIATAGLLTIVSAAAKGLSETRIARAGVVAGVENMGYVLLGLATGTGLGIGASMILAGMSAIAEIAASRSIESADPSSSTHDGRAQRGFRVVCVGSLFALPPTGVFLGRATVLYALFHEGSTGLALVAAVAVTVWASTLIHALQVSRAAFGNEPNRQGHSITRSVLPTTIALVLALVPVVAWRPIVRFAESSADSLMRKAPRPPARSPGPPRRASATIGLPRM